MEKQKLKQILSIILIFLSMVFLSLSLIFEWEKFSVTLLVILLIFVCILRPSRFTKNDKKLEEKFRNIGRWIIWAPLGILMIIAGVVTLFFGEREINNLLFSLFLFIIGVLLFFSSNIITNLIDKLFNNKNK